MMSPAELCWHKLRSEISHWQKCTGEQLSFINQVLIFATVSGERPKLRMQEIGNFHTLLCPLTLQNVEGAQNMT